MEHTCYICTRIVIGQSAVRAVQVLMKSQPQLLRSQKLISQVRITREGVAQAACSAPGCVREIMREQAPCLWIRC